MLDQHRSALVAFGAGGVVILLSIWVATTSPTPDALRLVASVLGFVGFVLLVGRLVADWGRTDVLVHALAILLLGSLLIASAGSARLAAHPGSGPVNEVLYLAILHRVAVIVAALMWPVWLQRHYSPFRSTPPTRKTDHPNRSSA